MNPDRRKFIVYPCAPSHNGMKSGSSIALRFTVSSSMAIAFSSHAPEPQPGGINVTIRRKQ